MASFGSPPAAEVLRPLSDGRQLELAEQLDFALEHDPELLERATSRLGHQGDRVPRGCATGVFDEVRVPRGDQRSADLVALETALLDHPTGTELVIRVLEDAAEGALVRGLCLLPPSLHRGDCLLDLGDRARREAEFDLRDDLAWDESGVSVRQVELVVRE